MAVRVIVMPCGLGLGIESAESLVEFSFTVLGLFGDDLLMLLSVLLDNVDLIFVDGKDLGFESFRFKRVLGVKRIVSQKLFGESVPAKAAEVVIADRVLSF